MSRKSRGRAFRPRRKKPRSPDRRRGKRKKSVNERRRSRKRKRKGRKNCSWELESRKFLPLKALVCSKKLRRKAGRFRSLKALRTSSMKSETDSLFSGDRLEIG